MGRIDRTRHFLYNMAVIKEVIMINRKNIVFSLLGSAILAFGLYHIHSLSGVTEGGALGLTLLLQNWFDISPAVSGAVINGALYLLGIKVLGKTFLFYSVLSGGGFSLFYAIFEQFPRLWPEIEHMPLTASLAGAVFVGVGVGLCILAGGAPTGDDALAMTVVLFKDIPIERVYFISDISLLVLSLSYIPVRRIAFSLLTVMLSSKLVGIIHRMGTASPEPDSIPRTA